jgi:hypothetical protein
LKQDKLRQPFQNNLVKLLPVSTTSHLRVILGIYRVLRVMPGFKPQDEGQHSEGLSQAEAYETGKKRGYPFYEIPSFSNLFI